MSVGAKTTQDEISGALLRRPRRKEAVPGLVLLCSVDRARCEVMPLRDGEIVIGRGDVGGVRIEDAQMSRRHARVRLDGERWVIEDLGSRNGTWVDGVALEGAREGTALNVLRAGGTLFLLRRDVEPYRAGIATAGGTVIGPTLGRAWEQIGRAARSGTTLCLRGESGTGKERAARAFHALGPRRERAFVAVNCAAIPDGLAERLLFGARRGAYSGATADAEGYVQAAHGGVLFLDEVAELEMGVQAKLLRALEAKEVIPLGASRPVTVDFALVSATNRDLRAEVAAKRLREDLFFRIARPEVVLPPLRERPEEVAWLVDAALREVDATGARGAESDTLRAHVSLIEACLQRAWPGNVRELLAEVKAAAQEARSAGASWVEAPHLGESAGQAFGDVGASGDGAVRNTNSADPGASRAERVKPGSGSKGGRGTALPDDAVIEEALRGAGGKVARAARALGIHRTQLRRWIARRTGGAEQRDG